MRPQKKNKTILIKGRTTLLALIVPIVFFSALLYLNGSRGGISLIGLLIPILIVLIIYFTMFYKRALFVTENKIHIFLFGKKSAEISLIDDLHSVHVFQNKIGQRMNFGTLEIKDKHGNTYRFYYLNRVVAVYNVIINQHVALVNQHNTGYDMEKIDHIDNEQEV